MPRFVNAENEALLLIAFPKAHFRCASVLLGPLPAQTGTYIASPRSTAHLVFYSLAHQSVLATLPLEGLL